MNNIFSDDFVNKVQETVRKATAGGTYITRTEVCGKLKLPKYAENFIGNIVQTLEGYACYRGRGRGIGRTDAAKKPPKLDDAFKAQLGVVLKNLVKEGEVVSRAKVAEVMNLPGSEKLISQALATNEFNYRTQRGVNGGIVLGNTNWVKPTVVQDISFTVTDNSELDSQVDLFSQLVEQFTKDGKKDPVKSARASIAARAQAAQRRAAKAAAAQ